jgi:UDP-N-acetylglucosamine 1-carboxyvinyltransferase
MLAAVLADGETIIKNAAREPEIVDLACFLNKCGARIRGAGDSTICICGVRKLTGCEYRIMPDRIAAATYISAAAITNGEITIKDIRPAHIDSFITLFEQMGCHIYTYANNIYLNAKKPLKSIRIIKTMPYPGFPTDAQAVTMAALCKAKGTSVFEENIFENRYRHVDELLRMGANIKVVGKAAIVEGVDKLYGAKVTATDLRGGAALVVAAVGAEGITEISEIKHIDRGYDSIEDVLSSIGVKIYRE